MERIDPARYTGMREDVPTRLTNNELAAKKALAYPTSSRNLSAANDAVFP